MYFPDLTPYQYACAEPQLGLLNIGWLSGEYPFPQGIPNEDFVAVLRKLVATPVRLFRGSHLCEFCPKPPTILSKGGIPMLAPLPGTTGNGEIHIKTANNTTYVAPVLILHYVTDHHYLPPQEFIDAALTAE
ncbi:DUF7919 family protein [Acidocella facilis]|uniref:DUF7919 family protein n=1 Tax=Acidocella facilis TaxID=525 RepID=UPI001F312112|nr:hypothetical protein [Acidocella facilis]